MIASAKLGLKRVWLIRDWLIKARARRKMWAHSKFYTLFTTFSLDFNSGAHKKGHCCVQAPSNKFPMMAQQFAASLKILIQVFLKRGISLKIQEKGEKSAKFFFPRTFAAAEMKKVFGKIWTKFLKLRRWDLENEKNEAAIKFQLPIGFARKSSFLEKSAPGKKCLISLERSMIEFVESIWLRRRGCPQQDEFLGTGHIYWKKDLSKSLAPSGWFG